MEEKIWAKIQKNSHVVRAKFVTRDYNAIELLLIYYQVSALESYLLMSLKFMFKALYIYIMNKYNNNSVNNLIM